MRYRTRPIRLLAVGVTAAVLAACGGDDDPSATAPAPAAPEETEQAVTAEEPVEEPVEEAPEAPEEVPFDPDAEIHPADIEVQEWGVGEVERPWEDLILPDDFVVPATAHQVTWAPPEEPFDGGRHGGSGAFRVYDADPAEVAAFFTDRLPDQGWELEEEQADGDAWAQHWVTRVPYDGWPEDWMADERAVEISARFTYLPGDGTTNQSTLQFHYRAEGVSHTWD